MIETYKRDTRPFCVYYMVCITLISSLDDDYKANPYEKIIEGKFCNHPIRELTLIQISLERETWKIQYN